MALLNYRLELFPKGAHLQEHLLNFLTQSGVCKVNIPNKARGELPALLSHARTLRTALPAPAAAGGAADICLHYSITHNYYKSAEASYAVLEDFVCHLADVASSGGESPASSPPPGGPAPTLSLLLVSGSARRRLDTIEALERLVASPRFRQLPVPPPLAVAFNPYLVDEEKQKEERQRLRRKLEVARGHLAAVYLQAGSDVERLDDGLHFLHNLLEELGMDGRGSQDRDAADGRPAKRLRHGHAAASEQQASSSVSSSWPAGAEAGQQECHGPAAASRDDSERRVAASQHAPCVYGSILLPSKKLLAQMRFRPWAGVVLGDKYLSSVDAAEEATLEVLRVYRQHGVVPVIETEVAGQDELARVHGMLASAEEHKAASS